MDKLADIIEAITRGTPCGGPEWRPVYALGLALTLLGLVWTSTMSRGRRSKIWFAWVGFWLFTAVFYALKSIDPISIPYAVARLGLDAASITLAAFFLTTETRLVRRHSFKTRAIAFTAVSTAAVAGADFADSVRLKECVFAGLDTACAGRTLWHCKSAGWHQLFDALILSAWAWRFKDGETREASFVVLVYGLTQLPFEMIFPQIDHLGYVRSTFLLYAILKITLIPSLMKIIEERAGSRVASPRTITR